jgi:hypothetical protein
MIRRMGKAVVDTLDFATFDLQGKRAEYSDRSDYPAVTGFMDEEAERLHTELKSRREMVRPEPVRIDTPSPARPGSSSVRARKGDQLRLPTAMPNTGRGRSVPRKGNPTDKAEQAVRKIGQVHGLIAGNSGVF